jgi:curved DNA-binding protein CbpA
MTGSIDPYKVLQVDPEAEDEVIQAAYRRLAQKYHPDRTAGAEASARMIAINAAWEMIGNPRSRANHDRERRAGESSPRTDGPAGRSRSEQEKKTAPGGTPGPRSPETVSSDWGSGRSGKGSGYDPASMRSADGFGAAGSPPGEPSGSVLNFGRFAGWSLGEIAGRDVDYIEWLDRMPIGRPYRDEIDAILRRAGRRKSAATDAQVRHGLFRRR